MHLPKQGSAYAQRVEMGEYVAQRLHRAKLGELEAPVAQAAKAVEDAGRAWEDSQKAVRRAKADRDAADDDLDLTAQNGRLALASRGVSAMREPPYTLIFKEGIEYFTLAPLDQEVTRYRQLVDRLNAHLPADDPTRTAAVPAIQTGIEAFQAATGQLDAARSAVSLTRMALETAEDAFDRVLEKTYAALVDRFGRKAAERYFPRAHRRQEEPADG
jgi:hypothetical protein